MVTFGSSRISARLEAGEPRANATRALFRKCAAGWLLSTVMILGDLAIADGQEAAEQDRIMAAFVLNFLKFVEWPPEAFAEAGSEIVLGVLGQGSIGVALEAAMQDKTAQGRKVRIRIFPTLSALSTSVSECSAIFVVPSLHDRWPQVRALIADAPILTVAAHPGFCAEAGMLNLVMKDERVRFEANPESTVRAGIRLRSELLKLALVVDTRQERP